jgi:choline dehydrogenase-like flavoprotein
MPEKYDAIVIGSGIAGGWAAKNFNAGERKRYRTRERLCKCK